MKLKINKKILISIIGILFCAFILYVLYIYSNTNKESFLPAITPVTYSESLINEYNEYFKKPDNKKNKTIDVENLQKLGVPENSVKQFISTGYWPYNQEFTNVVKQFFQNEPNTNNSTITDNILEIQANYPEQYLPWIAVAMYNYKFNQVAKSKKISCNIVSDKAIGDSMFTLDESGQITTTPVDNAQLPTLIPGFKFLSSPCNPCNNMNGNFNCPFAFPDKNGETLFPGFIMEYVWGLLPCSNTNSNTNTLSNSNTDSNSLSNLLNKFV